MDVKNTVSLENIHFIDQKQKELFQQARFGQQVVDFLNADIGRYLNGVAIQEMEIAKQKMADLKPGDSRFKNKYAVLKLEYEIAFRFTKWLAEAVDTGYYAEKQIEQEEY